MKPVIRVGLCGWNADEKTLELLLAFRQIGIEVAFLIANPEKQSKLSEIEKLTTIICQDEVVDIIVGREKGDEWGISGDELKTYSTHLPILLRAQERWLQGYWNIDDRLFMTHRAINYFNGLLKDENVTSIIHCTGSPHHFFNLVLNVTGERAGVSNFFLYYSFVTNRFFIVRGYEKIFYPLPSSLQQPQESSTIAYRKLIEHVTTQRDTRHQSQLEFYTLSAKFAILYLLFVLPRQLLKSFSREFIAKSSGVFLRQRRTPLRQFAKSVAELIGDFFAIFYFKRHYKKHCVAGIGNDGYVIYASYQPEASSHPDGGEFPDARYVAADLIKSGITVYYKEHPGTFLYHCVLYPNQLSKHRSIKYYEDLQLMGVRFIDTNTPNRDIFEKNLVIVSNAGTVLLEASLNGVKARAIGHPWYGIIAGIARYQFGNHEDLTQPESHSSYDISLNREHALQHFEEIDASSFANMFGVGALVVDGFPAGEIVRLSEAIRNVIEADLKGKS